MRRGRGPARGKGQAAAVPDLPEASGPGLPDGVDGATRQDTAPELGLAGSKLGRDESRILDARPGPKSPEAREPSRGPLEHGACISNDGLNLGGERRQRIDSSGDLEVVARRGNERNARRRARGVVNDRSWEAPEAIQHPAGLAEGTTLDRSLGHRGGPTSQRGPAAVQVGQAHKPGVGDVEDQRRWRQEVVRASGDLEKKRKRKDVAKAPLPRQRRGGGEALQRGGAAQEGDQACEDGPSGRKAAGRVAVKRGRRRRPSARRRERETPLGGIRLRGKGQTDDKAGGGQGNGHI